MAEGAMVGSVTFKYMGDTSGLDHANMTAEGKTRGFVGRISSLLENGFGNASKKASSVLDIGLGTALGNLASKGVEKVGEFAHEGVSKFAEFTKSGVELASNLTEVENVVDQTFGKNAGKIDAFAKKMASSYGLSELQAKQYSSTLGAMVKSMGLSSDATLKMSEDLTGLAGDIASFYNLNPDEAFEKIRSGISGETEPLKQLGINMDQANLKAFAMKNGMDSNVQSMNQAQLATLRYNYLLSVTKDAQGDFARTSGSYANQQRLLTMQLEQASAEMGKALLPSLQAILKAVTPLLPQLGQLLAQCMKPIAALIQQSAPFISQLVKFLMDLGKTVMPIITSTLQQSAPILKQIFQTVGQIVKAVLPVVLQIMKALLPVLLQIVNAVLPIVLQVLKQLMPLFLQIARQVLPVLLQIIKMLLPPLMEVVKTILPPLMQIIRALLPPLLQIIQAILPPLVQLIKLVASVLSVLIPIVGAVAVAVANVLVGAFKAISPVISAVIQVFRGIINFLRDVFVGDWGAVWNDVRDIFGGAFGALVGLAKAPINAVIGLINGLISALDMIHIPSWVPGIGGKGVNIPHVPYLAEGGVVDRPTLAMIGEAPNAKTDPEIVSPLSKLRGYLDTSMQLSRREGTTIVQVTVPPPTVNLDGEQIAANTERHQFISAAIRGVKQ